MSKEPKIDHEDHAGKDKMTITIHGYSLSQRIRCRRRPVLRAPAGAEDGVEAASATRT